MSDRTADSRNLRETDGSFAFVKFEFLVLIDVHLSELFRLSNCDRWVHSRVPLPFIKIRVGNQSKASLFLVGMNRKKEERQDRRPIDPTIPTATKRMVLSLDKARARWGAISSTNVTTFSLVVHDARENCYDVLGVI